MSEKLVLDLETKKEFAEVDGRKPELLGISVCGVYSYETNRYDAYLEAEIKTKLAPRLKDAGLVIGFNIRRFDFPVLQPYLPFPVGTIPMMDIMEEIVKHLGHRVSLGSLGEATLNRGKSGSGLDALQWFKEGRFDLITKYCLDDVKLTKDIYEYGKQHGKLFATSRFSDEKLQIPVFWPDRKRDLATITKVLIEAQKKRLQVEIEYLSKRAGTQQAPPAKRRVDVYHLHGPCFEGYCYFRKDVRQFRIDRVIDIKPTWNRYAIPEDFIPSAMAE